MKRILHKLTALVLAAALLASSVSAALGTPLRRSSLELSDTAAMTRGILSGSGGRQTEHILTYTPDSEVRPMVAYGTTLYGRSDLDYVAAYLEGTGKDVVAGVNGSFFTMSNGIPLGLVVTGGALRTSGEGDAIGFFDDGSAIIGKPGIGLTLTYPGGGASMMQYNKVLTKSNGVLLYSRDYDSTTKNTISAYNVVLSPERAEIVPGETITAQVTAVAANTASCAIPEGGLVLSMATDTEYTYTLENYLKTLQVGDTVEISCTIDAAWAGVSHAVGGIGMLVENGVANTEFTLDTAETRAARTAAGLKADGTLVLYTVDGRQSGYSAGVTLPELAQRMAELGCVTALNLDGGGSTTYSIQYPGLAEGPTTVNRPSDGQLRKCANFIFLARDAVPAGDAARLHLYPYDAVVLAGAELAVTVTATDDNWQAAAVPEDIQFSATGGEVDETGVFTAGESAGYATVTAASGGVAGSRDVRIVTDPTTVAVAREGGGAVTALALESGASVALTASALLDGMSVTAQDNCFQWSVLGGVGVIDENGDFIAAETTEKLTGSIVCWAGDARATVSVTVTPSVATGGAIFGFEPNETAAVSGTGLKTSSNRDLTTVRYGTASLRADYDLTAAAAGEGARRQVTAGLWAALPEEADTVGLWVYGDGSNNSLSLRFDVGGATLSKWLVQLNHTGWRYVTCAIPEGTGAVSGFAVTEYEEATADRGVILLDQLVATRGVLADETPPDIQATVTDSVLYVLAADGGSGLASGAITLDGALQAADWNDGAAALALPADGAAHQVRITAVDRYGNRSSMTAAIDGSLSQPFGDMNGHWAEGFVSYCVREGILQGSSDGGVLRYRPNDSMTRQEFAVALMRFQGVDTAQYSGVELPFADRGGIAAWAMPAMRAAYSLGFITGSSDGGVLYAHPTSTITRQEAMAILGRTQVKGYAEDDLSEFRDAGTVASWARGHIAAMVSRGVINGADGILDPNGTVTRAQVAKMLYGLY